MASLDAAAAQLKATGTPSLDAMTTGRYTRTLAGDGLARQNPFEEEKGHAPSEEVGPHSLDVFAGYDHDVVESGTGLQAVVGYEEITYAWVQHAGYPLAPGVLRQLLSVKSMGASEDLSVNPFDTPDDTDDAGDVEEWSMVGLTAGDFYAAGLKGAFNDSDEEFVPPDATACDPHGSATPLSGAGEGISSDVAVFSKTPGPVSATQTTDPDSCVVGADVTLNVVLNMSGPSLGRLEEQVNGGSWDLVDASVSAGTTSVNLVRASNGDNYKFRVRYLDVSPDTWGTMSGTITPLCNLP